MKSTGGHPSVNFKEWVMQGNALVKKLTMQHEKAAMDSKTSVTIPPEDDDSSVCSTLTTVSSDSFVLCPYIEGVNDFLNSDSANNETLEHNKNSKDEGRDCKEKQREVGLIVSDPDKVQHSKAKMKLSHHEDSPRHSERKGLWHAPYRDSDSRAMLKTSILRKRKGRTFRGKSRKRQKMEESCTFHVGGKENGTLCLLEGFMDGLRLDDEKFTRQGRIFEVDPLNPMRKGDWTVKTTSQGESTIHICLRHTGYFSDENCDLEPDAPLSASSHDNLELRIIDPAQGRPTGITSQTSLKEEDLCFVKVASLSLFAFRGFSSSSECRNHSKELANLILPPTHTTESTKNDLHISQLHDKTFGAIAGVTFTLPRTLEACNCIVVALDKKTQDIVAVDGTSKWTSDTRHRGF